MWCCGLADCGAEKKDDDERRGDKKKSYQEAGETHLIPAHDEVRPDGEEGDEVYHLLLPPITGGGSKFGFIEGGFDVSAFKLGEALKFGFIEGGFTGQAARPGGLPQGAGEGDPGRPAHSSLPGGGAMCPQGSVHRGSGEASPTCCTTGVLYCCTRTRLGKDIFPATCRGSNGAKGKDRTPTCEILPPYSLHLAPSHTTCPPIYALATRPGTFHHPTPNLASPPRTTAFLPTPRGAGGGGGERQR